MAVAITVQAQAGKQAAEDNAHAILIEAKAAADALKLTAEANEKVYAVEAQGKRVQYEADNLLSTEQVELQRSLAILAVLPELIANAVKPLENIDGIKILQGYGSNSTNQVMTAGNDNQQSSPLSLSEQVTSAALNYRANTLLVDNMLK